MPVTLSDVTNIDVRGTNTSWTPALTLIHAELSPVKVPTSLKVFKRYPNLGASHVRISPERPRNARVPTDGLYAHIVLDRPRLS